jgi:hypothetical protein
MGDRRMGLQLSRVTAIFLFATVYHLIIVPHVPIETLKEIQFPR